MDVKSRIRQFVTENFYLPDPAALDDNASLIDLGVVDSTGVLEVISFLESTFELTVREDETVPENLDSIARITAYVERKRLAAAA
jgi:acyl carrier protein